MKLDLLQSFITNSGEQKIDDSEVPVDTIVEENAESTFPGMLAEAADYQDVVADLEHLKQTDRRTYERIMNWD